MLPTFVIGLREGLEAALIVGIVAAFLRQQGRRDLLRWVFLGVGVAIGLCVAVGVAIQLASGHLPQRQQEGLETVIGLIAVAMVTYMVVWMKQHSRDLKGQLEGLAARAMDEHSGAARAMVLMAFLAVLREGLETVLFLIAAFNESDNPSTAASGAVLGILLAVLLGYGIYRGGVRINLSKFFRATGVVLVLVAAGLVVNALHTAHEAGWINSGQGATVDLTWLVKPGSVQASLLTGMLGLQPKPVLIEVAGWLAYLVPVLVYVAWAPGPRASRTMPRALAVIGAAFGAGAVVMAAIAPSAPAVGAAIADGPASARLVAPAENSSTARVSGLSPAGSGGDTRSVDVPLTRSGNSVIDGVDVITYTGTFAGTAADSLPGQLSIERIVELNHGRLPLGLRAADGTGDVPVTYSDVITVTVAAEPRTRTVLTATWDESVAATLHDAAIGEVPLSDPVLHGAHELPADVTNTAAQRVASGLADLDARTNRVAWAWGLGAVALTSLLMAALVLLGGRRKRDASVTGVHLDKSLVHS